MKKRRFRELERCWDMQEHANSENLVGICEDNLSARSEKVFEVDSSVAKSKRQLKLEKKLISKAALETELMRGGLR
jgi:hypothetical protein